MSPIPVLLAIFGVASISAVTVKWLPNSSFKLPANFKDGKLPCSKQTVVFPQTIVGSIKIASGTEVQGFILPEDGELILDGLLVFGSNPTDANCTDGNAYYLDKSSSSWNQADVWSSPKFNKATPDSERIPCFNDKVEFPVDAKFTISLPRELQYVKEIKIGNRTFHTSNEFSHRVWTPSDEPQQFILNEFLTTGVKINEQEHCSMFGCPCQQYPLQIDCSAKFCPKPTCEDPVKPLGFCCEICGGYILFDPNEGFDMATFGNLVDKTVDKYGKNSVEYHTSFSPEIPYRRIQLIVVDKGEYEGLSAEIISAISYSLHDHWVRGNKVALISGNPLSTSGVGGKIFVSMFFVVVLTFGAIYVYYYRIPDVRFPNFSRDGPGNIFMRFQRRSDSVVSLTRRDSVTSSSSRFGTAFRNPLYDSKRGRVVVAETVAEE